MFGGNTDKLPKAAPTLLGLDSAQTSTSQEFRPVPVIFGTPKSVGATQLTYRFDLFHETKESKKGGGETRIYYASWAGLICQGPVKTLSMVIANKAEAWPLAGGAILTRDMAQVRLVRVEVTAGGSGYSVQTVVEGSNGAKLRPIIRGGVIVGAIVFDQGLDTTVATPPTITATDPGGGTGATFAPVVDAETYRQFEVSGGGTLRFYWGSANQDFDPHLISLSEDQWRNPPGTREGNAPEEHPAYVGQCYYVAINWKLGTNTTQIPNLEFVIGRPVSVPYITDLLGLGTDANPVVALAEVLGQTRWGLGQDPAEVINQDNFDEMADNVATEALGVSMVLNEAQDFYKFTVQLLEYIHGYLTTGPDGRLMLGLIRDPGCQTADPGLNLYLDEDALTEPPSLDPVNWDDTKNQVHVGFSNSDLNSKVQSASAPNLENFKRTRTPRPITLDRTWFTKLGVADMYARAAAAILGTPKQSGSLKVRQSKIGTLDIGQIFRLTWAHWNLCFLKARVMEMRWANPFVREVEILFEVDRGYLTDQVVATPVYHVPVPVVYEPVAPNWRIVELPFNPETKTDPYLALLVSRMDTITSAFRVYVIDEFGNDGGQAIRQSSAFAYRASLTASVPVASNAPVDIMMLDADKLLPYLFGMNPALSEWLVFIGDEIMSIGQSVVVSAAAHTYRLFVEREHMDTGRAAHDAGAEVWIVSRAALARTAFKTGKASAAGDVTTLAMQTSSLGTWLADADTPQDTIIWRDRAKRHWKPRGLTVNGVAWFDGPTWATGAAVALAWTITNRNGAAGWEPEMSALWHLEIYNAAGELVATERYSPAVASATLSNAYLQSKLGGETDFTLRFYAAQRIGDVITESLASDQVLVTKV